VLASGPNARVGPGFSSTRNMTVSMGLTTRKTSTIENVLVLPPKTRHFKFTMLDRTKHLTSDRFLT
jgi:hypothetical protein